VVTIVLVAILLAFSIGLKIISNVIKSNANEKDKNLYKVPLWGSRVAILALMITIMGSTVRVIAAGHVGVATLFGQVQPLQLTEGIHFVNPLLSVTEMSAQVQKHEGKYDAASKDMQAVHVEMVVNYRLLPDKATDVYQKIGVKFASIIIDPAAQEVLKANTALHIASDILLKRPLIKSDIQKGLTEWALKYGVEVKEVSIVNISFDKAYENAIEAKQIEQQRADQKVYELIQAQKQAEIVAAAAKGVGNAAMEQSKGQAEALQIKAVAEAEYNKKITASLSPILIQQQYLVKWDGKLPQFITSGSGMLFQLPVLNDEKK
jgi:regulator of protease activity HflC (stomatin/prohibitin superfamily)